ncbi:anthranilate synthase component I [Temperatibacter marinus]|uniref:Anthranilate synthase component 1 n=1 Tax=Temperatibacter marinus TaxID=1456591 RepID=A0AA52EEW4_9PROT|nr:anthranilate synthase component I [Temperatibacter marinus]WND02368.1 anthranilate synthase component I [Temperatibacter marinus]
MTINPDYSVFQDAYSRQESQVLFCHMVADLDTPVSAYMKLSDQERYSFLLESVEGGETRGRYSIIGMKPDLIWRSDKGVNQLCQNPEEETLIFTDLDTRNPIDSLRTVQQDSLFDLPDSLPPMASGLVGYMGYDMVRHMEDISLMATKDDPVDVPESIFIRPKIMAIFDSVTNLITLVATIRPKADLSAKEAYDQAVSLIRHTRTKLRGPVYEPIASVAVTRTLDPTQSNTEKEHYKAMVEKAQEYILAGDIFQVVLSQRFSVPFELQPFELYRALRRTNPSPFLFHLNFDDFALTGSSPEILVRLRDETVTIRPIAGTRKRGRDKQEDQQLMEDLLSDPKELSEHLMLLDLGRNDVGRVTKSGTVEVTDSHSVELYSHVMHIVSNVEGTIEDGLDCFDALKAGFPAGTVSGAPKVRAMEIIDELEIDKRGPYAGSVGYFSVNGTMDSCIVLRTAIVKDRTMYIQAGAGVVADSDPESEYQECVNKARALVNAAEEAVRFSSRS